MEEVLHEEIYMFAKRTRKYGDDKRVRLDRPYYFIGKVFTVVVEEPYDKSRGVKGWTYDDLKHGKAARRFFPCARITGMEWDEASQVCEMMNNLALAGITTTNMRKLQLEQNPTHYPAVMPPLLGWDEQHRRTVTIDGVEVEAHGWAWGPTTGPRAYGNLAWAWMTHINIDRRKWHVEHRVLVDLETLRQTHPFPDGSRDWVVDTVHHVERDTCYSEGVQYLDYITRWEEPRAAEYVARRTQQG